MQTVNSPATSQFEPLLPITRVDAASVDFSNISIITSNIKSDTFEREKRSLGIRTKSASPSRDEVVQKRFGLQSEAARLMPQHRVAGCLRNLAYKKRDHESKSNARYVDVMYSPDSDSAHYKGLQLCGSVWDCPVCAAKITELRRQELTKGMTRAKELGLYPIHVTTTQRHLKHQSCESLLQQFNRSARKFKSGKGWQTIAAKYGIIGSIRSKEPTNTEKNGWHIHHHEAMFLDHTPTAQELVELESALKLRWVKSADADWQHGLKVEAGHEALSNYVSKFGVEKEKPSWTLEHEITKSHVKKASLNGRTPFQLLEAAAAGEDAAGELFKEYSAAFKGQRQLVWTKGLRALLGLDEVEATDEELAELEQAGARLAVQLLPHQWYAVVGNDCRAELLQVVRESKGDPDLIWKFLVVIGIKDTRQFW